MKRLETTDFQRLSQHLMGFFMKASIEAMGRRLKLIKRRKKMTAFSFLTVSVLGPLDCSLESQASGMSVPFTRQALAQRFSQPAASFLQLCLNKLIEWILLQPLKVELKTLNFCKRLLVLDSSTIPLPSKLSKVFPGCGGSGGAAACKLQLLWDLLSGQIQAYDITAGRKPDQAYADECASLLNPKDLILFDLGYFKYALLQAIQNRGCYFLTRLLFGRKILDPVTKKEIEHSKISAPTAVDLDVLIAFGQNTIACRLISLPTPPDVAAKRRRKVKEDVRRKTGKTPSRKRLEFCQRTVFVTNVPRENLSLQKVPLLYALRWQIELLFKMLKSVLKLEALRTSNQHRVTCHILARLIRAVLLCHIHGSFTASFFASHRFEFSLEKLSKRSVDLFSRLLTLLNRSQARAIQYLTKQLPMLLRYSKKCKQKTRQNPFASLDLHDNTTNLHVA